MRVSRGDAVSGSSSTLPSSQRASATRLSVADGRGRRARACGRPRSRCGVVQLRPIGKRELSAILRGQPDPELPWEEGFPAPPLLDFLEMPPTRAILGPFYAYLIVRAADGLAVGDAGFHGPPRPDGELEVGYALGAEGPRRGPCDGGGPAPARMGVASAAGEKDRRTRR